EFDVVIIGAGPAGLSAACRIRQLSEAAGKDISVCVVEKGSEVGAHILSGAVMQPTAMNELFPDWKEKGAPLNIPVSGDEIHFLLGDSSGLKLPAFVAPPGMHNDGNYVISLGNVCRWLAEQAEGMGVDIYPGFAADRVLYNDDGSVIGIGTSDMGVSESGEHKDGYMQGMDLIAKYTIFSEGCRGHLGKQLMERFELNKDSGTQHYGLGIKELWEIDPAKHKEGLVIHTIGWPLSETKSTGGGFLYHLENNQVTLGLMVDLSYTNPHLSPFDEMQRWKTHPTIKQFLEGGKRISYGARAINKGGLQAIPKLTFPGGLLTGCDAGFMNMPKIKGSHNAMKTGMLAGETVYEALSSGKTSGDELTDYTEKVNNSWVYQELKETRNVAPALHKFGMLVGGAITFIDQNIFRGKLPFTLQDPQPDHETLKLAGQCKKIDYPKPDGTLTFNKLDSVFLSNTNHAEDQPCHLQLADTSIPLDKNLPMFDEPAQRYCPAGVYEIVEEENGDKRFQINAQNCVHCKTCDIKDPAQNINWITPEGGGGPNYPNM
ncbi:MAG: electron transfer flavoprotein-ubiquinone oxidoreductase, partial [Pseudomonadales bacterium]